MSAAYVPPAKQRIAAAIAIINQSGGVDGDHHKAWVIDQVLRVLCDTPAHYDAFVKARQDDGYDWYVGIPP